MAIFATDAKVTFNDIRIIDGTVTELVDAAEMYVKNAIHWRVEFTGKSERDEIPEIPIEALREALNNSFCHRLFTSAQNNEVLVFKNRIEIYNPGTFPEGVSPQSFINEEESPIHRNPLLADTLYYTKEVETFGTGLRRIHDYCQEAGVHYEFRLRKYGFAVVFFRPVEATEDKLNTATQKRVYTEVYSEGNFGKDFGISDAQYSVLKIIMDTPSITTEEIARQLDKTSRAIEYHISKLKQVGILAREGAKKDGHWVVKPPTSKN